MSQGNDWTPLHISPAEVTAHKRFFAVSEADANRADRLHDILDHQLEPVLDSFYSHLKSQDQLADILGGDSFIERFKTTHRAYLLGLGRKLDELPYYQERFQIGIAHKRVGLDQLWFLGAYTKLFDEITPRIAAALPNDPEQMLELVTVLARLFLLDAALVADSYHRTATDRLQGTLDRLTETEARLTEAVRIDGLTQLYNRAYLTEVLEREIDRSRRYEDPFALLMLDVDHFKRINDQHGHLAGDEVLRGVARVVRRVLRKSDLVGRFGGEEFLIGLVHSDQGRAVAVAERLRRGVEEEHFGGRDSGCRATVSIGISILGDSGAALEDMIQAADEALYRAKNEGRNAIRLAA